MFSENEFFYCYSSRLFKFLKMDKKINYVCTGLHEVSFEKFWQFKSNDELNAALSEYRVIMAGRLH